MVGSGGVALLIWGNPAPTVVSVGTIPPAYVGAAAPAPATAPSRAAAPHAGRSGVTQPSATEPVPSREPGAPPIRVRIPSIGVDTSLIGLRIQRDGTLGVPQDFAVAGWWRDGVAPGDPGPAVIVGHIDSFRGPAVFYKLRALTPGEIVTIDRADGTTVDFVVDGLREFPKQRFPTNLVYGATKTPTLRLITCGGGFDHVTGHYVDNVVAFLHLAPKAPQHHVTKPSPTTQTHTETPTAKPGGAARPGTKPTGNVQARSNG